MPILTGPIQNICNIIQNILAIVRAKFLMCINHLATFSRPIFANLAMEPVWIAPVGQISLQARGISSSRSMPGDCQKLHFSILP
jgi:hypothetical protein